MILEKAELGSRDVVGHQSIASSFCEIIFFNLHTKKDIIIR
jgi:hypothetical protein